MMSPGIEDLSPVASSCRIACLAKEGGWHRWHRSELRPLCSRTSKGLGRHGHLSSDGEQDD